MIPIPGERVIRDDGRRGEIVVVTHLDWADVRFDDRPEKLELVHSGRLRPEPVADSHFAGAES